MTIAEAKQLRIVDYLARLGHRPRSIKSDQYWYFSPLRDERTPSFKVNDRGTTSARRRAAIWWSWASTFTGRTT